MRRSRLGTFAVFISIILALISSFPLLASTDFANPTGPAKLPRGIVAGPDNNLWFVEQDGRQIGKMTPTGSLTEFPVTGALVLNRMTVGPDGNLWFTDTFANFVGKIPCAGSPTVICNGGAITEYPLPANSGPTGIVSGPGSALWVAEQDGHIAQVTTAGAITQFPVGNPGTYRIAAGSDGNLWFTMTSLPVVGRMTPSGQVTFYSVPSGVGAYDITLASDNNIWFSEGGFVGSAKMVASITKTGAITEYPTTKIPKDIIGNTPDGRVWFREGGFVGAITTNGVASDYDPCNATNCVGGGQGITKGPGNLIWLNSTGTGAVASLNPSGPTSIIPGNLNPDLTNFFPLGPGSDPNFITAGPDGKLWFTSFYSNQVSSIPTTATVSSPGVNSFALPNSGSPEHITTGPDGNLWLTDDGAGALYQVTTTGAVTQFLINGGGACLFGIVTGSDNNLWVTDYCNATIYKVTTAAPSAPTSYAVPTGNGPLSVFGITSGPDGNLWYANYGTNSIGRITTAGVVTEFPLPAGASKPYAITKGPDGNLWFASEDNNGTVGKITTTGVYTLYPAANTNGCAQDITTGADNTLWINISFCGQLGQDIESVSTNGNVTISGTTYPFSGVVGIASGPDNKLWLADLDGARISRLSAISGTVTLAPSGGTAPTSVTANAQFVDGTPTALATDMTATINWGDGSAAVTAPVSGSTGGPFTVAATHAYTQVGSFTVSVALHDAVDNANYTSTAVVSFGQPTNTFLYSSNNPVPAGFILTLTARVAGPSGAGIPTGAVVFQDQTSANLDLGTGTVGPDGYASFSLSAQATSALALGNHKLVAIYSGDTTFLGSTSPALNESVQVSSGFLFKDNGGNNYGTGTAPVDAVIGDFNRDGILDFAVADSSNNTLGVFLGNGDGTFRAAGAPITLPAAPRALASGDFNGDGKLDIIVGFVAGASPDVGIMLGNGDGTFGSLTLFGTDTAQVDSLATADFNHDGKLDIAVGDDTGNLTNYLGNGNGTFAAQASFSTSGVPDQLLVADFNNDGKPDLVAVEGGQGIFEFLGNGDGTFQSVRKFNNGTNPYRMAIGDLNRDGNTDIVVTDKSVTSLFVLLGDGTGNFAAAATYPLDDTSCYPVVDDVNHDGILDVGMPCPTTHGEFLLGNGDGTFGPFITAQPGPKGTPDPVIKIILGDFNRDGSLDALVVNGNGDTSPSLFVSPGPLEPTWGVGSVIFGTQPWDVTVGSFRNNGKLDLAFTDNSAQTVDVLSNNGSGVFSAPTGISVGDTGLFGILAGDLNFDGNLDLLWFNQGSNNFDVSLGAGNGTFGAAVATSLSPGLAPQYGVLGDFNGDGKPDLAVALGSSQVAVLLGNGNGTFAAPVFYALTGAANGIAEGDFNGDGKLDLAVAVHGDNSINVLLGNGDGTFQAAVRYALPASITAPVGIRAADFNRDGKLDLAFTGNGASSLGIMLGNGDGTFQATVTYPVPGSVNVGGMTLLDANRDGKLDIALVDTAAENVVLFEGNGDGSFRLAGTYPLPAPGGNAAPRNIATGDFNGDGAPDLVTADEFLPGASVLLSNQKTSTVTSYSACNTPDAVALGDFNGDGVQDMAVVNAGCNSVTIRLGNGDGTFQPSSTSYTVQSSPSAIAIGDFNGDGKLDLAVTNKGSNSVSILIGKGDGTFVVTNTYPVGVGPNSISASDVNKDGKLDLVVANSGDGTLSVLKGNGDGTFQTAVTVASMHPGHVTLGPSLISPLAVAMGDLNGDNAPDMIVADSGNNDIAVLLNSGGTFPSTTTYSTGAGSRPSAIALGAFQDLTANKSLDMAVADAGSNDVAVFLNTGSGTFPATPTKYAVGRVPDAIAVLDYNSDGHLDIVVANSGDNTVMVLLGNGDGTFQAPITIAAGTGPNGLAVGNLTGGGNGDMVVTNGNSGSVSVLLNAAAVLLGGASSGTSVYGQPALLSATALPAVKSTRIPTGMVNFKSGSTLLGHAVLGNQGTGTLSTSLLPVGTNTITLTYSGDNFFNTQVASILQTVTQATPNITVVPSANPAGFGQLLTLTAIVSSPTGVGIPTGSVSFADSVQGPLGSAPLDGTGAGSLSVSSLAVGIHSITATYNGDNNFKGVTSLALSETINKQPTSLTLNSSANPAFFNQSVTFAAHLSASGVPTGNINFMDGNTLLASVAPNAFGDAQYTTSSLSVATHSITAQYAGDANFGASMAGLTETVNKAPVTLEIVSSANPSTVAAPAQFTVTVTGAYGGTPSGSIAFTDGATTLPGSPVALSGNMATLQPSLAAGVHTIHASYAGDGNFSASSDGIVQVVNNGGAATTLSVSASANPVYFNRDPAKQQVTLTATLSSGTAGTPTGTIMFMDDDQVLAPAQPLSTTSCSAAACVATFTTDHLTIGAHHIIAIYAGDGTYAGTTSSTPAQPFYELDRSPRFKR